jgi:RNA polymerase sigma-70 factor (ECF subfamily)
VVPSRETETRGDAELLLATPQEAQAFAAFYRRHVHGVLSFFRVRVRDPEVAADLMAETFAAALAAARRYRPRRAAPEAWLYAIARHKLIDASRRGQVRDEARRRLRMERLELEDEDLRRIDDLVSEQGSGRPALTALAGLVADQRAAVSSRVLDEQSYEDIAREMRCSEAVARKRVSRGLDALRTELEDAP